MQKNANEDYFVQITLEAFGRAVNLARQRQALPKISIAFTAIAEWFWDFCDKTDFKVVAGLGDKAFVYEQSTATMKFNIDVVLHISRQYHRYWGEAESFDEVAQSSVNWMMMFFVHEVLHNQQNLSDFNKVQMLKAALPPSGMAIVDSAADVAAASLCAMVTCLSEDDNVSHPVSQKDYLEQFVNFLSIAYIVLTEAFDVTSDVKKQRALGLLLQISLIQAWQDETINWTVVNRGWVPDTMIYALNIFNGLELNGMIYAPIAGLIFDAGQQDFQSDAIDIWHLVGKISFEHLIDLVSKHLFNIGAITTSPSNTAP